MDINWRLRFKNRTTVTALISALVVFVFQVAGALGVTLPVGADQVMQAVTAVLTVLAALGIVTDPTTSGVGDSDEALQRTEPKGA